MKGFFEIEDRCKNKKKKKSKKLIKQVDICKDKCKLYNSCLSPQLDFTGAGEKGVLVVGEAQGKNEDEQKKQFVGKSGKFLRKSLNQLGISMDRDCWVINAVRCRPPKNNTPTTAQVNYCRKFLKKTIQKLQPKKIIALGKIALQGLIGDKINDISIGKWVGWRIPDQDFRCWIFPNYHPAYILRIHGNSGAIVVENRFQEFLKNAFEWGRKWKKITPQIQILQEEKLIEKLESINNEIIAIDYETTGLKPHREGHKILSVSITRENLETFAFELKEKFKPYICRILQESSIKKVFHNCKFENMWSKKFLTEINNIHFDTMLSSHILDNRSGITSLKFQAYINFGVVGYEKEIGNYIHSSTKGGNEFNRLDEIEKEKLLEYNGYDTFFTMLLYKKHYQQLDIHLKKGMELFLNGSIELGNLGGIRFDRNYYKKIVYRLDSEIENLRKEIINSREVQKLENPSEFNEASNKQLRELLYDKCEWEPLKKTRTTYSVDEETLSKYNRKFTNNILRKRHIEKIKNTYLEQFKREMVVQNSIFVIHPFFNLNTVSTYRSSSSNPNFQNIPVRNNEAKKYVRGCLIPRQNRQLLEIDFKGMEVAIGCCYHQDPNMIQYILENGDMHSDIANQLFFRKFDFVDNERYCAKNGFVFPSFYGSTSRIFKPEHEKIGAGDITINIWNMLSDDTRNHLREKKIQMIQDFQNHVEKIEWHFWNERFPIYHQWRLDNWHVYKKRGYIELKTGFCCNSIMSFNDVNNYSIQGTAFHVLLWCLIELNKWLRKEKMQSMIIGQIHDSIVLDIVPIELDLLLSKIRQICTIDVRDYWSWIVVPLSVEAEITGINESWDKKVKIGIL